MQNLVHRWPDAGTGDADKVVFCEGSVTHIRQRPKRHSFKYTVRVAVIRLDDPPTWFQAQAADHMTADQARAYAGTNGPVWLLTNPVAAGYTINPISVYYCYDDVKGIQGASVLSRCIAEVTNTPWNERVTFVFMPRGKDSIKKALHVSPLMDMTGTWQLEASDPLTAPDVRLVVRVQHPSMGPFFYADLVAQRCTGKGAHSRNERAGLGVLCRYGLQPHRIALWIYWHAVLLLCKGVPLYSPPPASTLAEAAKQATHPVNRVALCPFTWRPAPGYPWDSWGGKLPEPEVSRRES